MSTIGLQLASVASPEIVRTAARSLPVLARYVATLPGLSRSFTSGQQSGQKNETLDQPQGAPAGADAVEPAASKRLTSCVTSRGSAVSPLLREMQALMPPPFRRVADQMLQMQHEMDSLMGAFGMPRPSMLADPWEVFDRAAGPLAEARRPSRPLAVPRMMPLEASEDPEGYTLTAEVPGFDKKDIKVSLSEDGVLTLSGSLEESSEPAGMQAEAQAAAPKEAREGGEAAATSEGEAAKRTAPAPPSFRRRTSFTRSVQLPDDVDPAAITATTQNGLLTVRIPKVAAAEPKVREIPVA